jgi:hypothetical protein
VPLDHPCNYAIERRICKVPDGQCANIALFSMGKIRFFGSDAWRGRVVGVEVKAAASVSRGDRFALGLVLYDHDQIVPFGDLMLAAPLSALWA